MRNNRIDVLRAIALSLVLGRHVYVTKVWFRSGWMGVDLFFVLSGFLVSGLLFTEQRKHGRMWPLRFWLRRAFKIYPPFYFLVAASAIVGAHQEGQLLPEVLFYQNYVHGWWHHTWSLAVEEHFYVLLPIALVVLERLGRGRPDPFRSLPALVLALAIGVLALRVRSFAEGPQRVGPGFFFAHVFPTHLRIDSLAFGALIAYFYSYRAPLLAALNRGHLIAIAAASALAIALCTRTDIEGNALMATVGLTVLYLGFGGVLVVCLQWPTTLSPSSPFGRTAAALGYVGRNSYSIYLWHLPVMLVTEAVFARYAPHTRDQVMFVVFAPTSIVVGIALSKVIEGPALRLRERLLPPPARSPAIVIASAAPPLDPS